MGLKLISAAVSGPGLVLFDNGPRLPTETDIFNAYLYLPGTSGREVYLGKVTGISQCQSAAGSYARRMNISQSDPRSCICCREYKGSSCYEKYR